MGSYAVLEHLDYDGKSYKPGGKPVTIGDDVLVARLQDLRVIGRELADQDDETDLGPARIRISTLPGLPAIEAGRLTFSSDVRPIGPGEIDEAQLLAMVEEPSLRIEVLPFGADPLFGWEVWGSDVRASAAEALRDHVEYDIEHGRPHDRVGWPAGFLAEQSESVSVPADGVDAAPISDATPAADAATVAADMAASLASAAVSSADAASAPAADATVSAASAGVAAPASPAAPTASAAAPAPAAASVAAAPTQPTPKPKTAPKAKAAAKAGEAGAK